MKIGIQIERFIPTAGGAEAYTCNLAGLLLAHGHGVAEVEADAELRVLDNLGQGRGVGELGRHALKAFVHRVGIKHFVELLVDYASHVLQVPADPGWILNGVNRCGACHLSNVDPMVEPGYPFR